MPTCLHLRKNCLAGISWRVWSFGFQVETTAVENHPPRELTWNSTVKTPAFWYPSSLAQTGGNHSQKQRLAQNFRTAVRVLQQGDSTAHIQPVPGICYGRAKATNVANYIKYEGQGFWHFLSGDPNLYTSLIEPVGYLAREQNESFRKRRAALEAEFIEEFTEDFVTPTAQSTGAVF